MGVFSNLLFLALISLQEASLPARGEEESIASLPGTPATPPTNQDSINNTPFLDSLTGPGGEMTATFGLELVEGLRKRKMQCNMNLSQAELNHTREMENHLDYHRSVEKLMLKPGFSEFAGEDRADIEANFHATVQHLEASKNKKLLRIKGACDTDREAWLTERFLQAVSYARRLLEDDRRHYTEVMAQMADYREHMLRHLRECRPQEGQQQRQHQRQSGFELLYCYVEELEASLDLMGRFFQSMEVIAASTGDTEEEGEGEEEGERRREGSAGISGDDDGDDDGDDESSGEISTPPMPHPTTSPTKAHKLTLPPGFFVKEPVVTSPDDDDGDTSKTTPTTGAQTTPTREVTTPASANTEVSSTATSQEGAPLDTPSPTPPTDGNSHTRQESIPTVAAEISVSRSPGEADTAADSDSIPTLSSSSPHREATGVPEWLDEAFDNVLRLKEQTAQASNSKTPKRNPSSSSSSSSSSERSRPGGGHGDEEGEPRPPHPPRPPARPAAEEPLYRHHQHQHQHHHQGHQAQEAFEDFDPRPQQTTNEESQDYVVNILTFFFITVGVVIIAFGAIVIAVISAKRFRKRRRRRNGGGKLITPPPELSEKDMLEVMKKTGYVNPTYKFYEQT